MKHGEEREMMMARCYVCKKWCSRSFCLELEGKRKLYFCSAKCAYAYIYRKEGGRKDGGKRNKA